VSVNDIFGKCLLLNLLEKRRLTQADIAAMTGISKTQINEYISNTRRMSLANAYLISCALKCHVEELYTWKIK
jgi:putative transcriptional regulator